MYTSRCLACRGHSRIKRRKTNNSGPLYLSIAGKGSGEADLRCEHDRISHRFWKFIVSLPRGNLLLQFVSRFSKILVRIRWVWETVPTNLKVKPWIGEVGKPHQRSQELGVGDTSYRGISSGTSKCREHGSLLQRYLMAKD